MTKLKTITISSLAILLAFGLISYSRANEAKIYISNGNVYYDCPDGAMAAPAELNIDIESVEIINDRFFKDKNNVYNVAEDWHSHFCLIQKMDKLDPDTFEFLNNYYQKDKNNVYISRNYWGWGSPSIIEQADTDSFEILSEKYAKDKNRAYYASLTDLFIMENIDTDTFEVLKEDAEVYAMDKNNMYLHGKILTDQGEEIKNNSIYNSVKGKIILKVEENGEAYYVSPNKQEMYFLSRPVIAFQVMRKQGIGITNKDLEKIPVASFCPGYAPLCDNLSAHDLNFAKKQNGKIFLQVEEKGEAWYVNPNNSMRYFLGRPADAFNVMRNLGLGISNGNFENLVK